jgi:hypothetical protein
VFPGASLSDRPSIDGGGHGTEGTDESDMNEVNLRSYRTGKDCVSGVLDVGGLKSRAGPELLPSRLDWPANPLAED